MAKASGAEKIILPGGARVVLAPRPEAAATTVMLLADTVSKYESRTESGLSHFLEHMFFKGTKKRPRTSDIAIELDGLGAQYNAFTSQEYPGYFASFTPSAVERALAVLADMYLHSTFPAAEIEKERGVIVEEINMYEDVPQRHIQDLFTTLVYGDQPAGWPIIGSKETVRAFQRQDFLQYRAKHYVSEATLAVVAGNFNPTKIFLAIKREMATLPAPASSAGKLPVVENQSRPAVFLKTKASDQPHLVLGFRAFSARDPRAEAMELLAAVLGGNMSSRLFRKIRDELGAAYYVRATNDASTDHGVLQVAVGADNARVETVIKAVLNECRQLVEKPVPPAELARAKEALIGQLHLGLETTSGLTNFYGLSEIIRGRIFEPAALARRIKAITAGEIKRSAGEIFRPAGLNLALIGPAKNARFESLL